MEDFQEVHEHQNGRVEVEMPPTLAQAKPARTFKPGHRKLPRVSLMDDVYDARLVIRLGARGAAANGAQGLQK